VLKVEHERKLKSRLARAEAQVPISPDCVFDASLMPETCLDRFVDLKGFTQQVYGESHNRTLRIGPISLLRLPSIFPIPAPASSAPPN